MNRGADGLKGGSGRVRNGAVLLLPLPCPNCRHRHYPGRPAGPPPPPFPPGPHRAGSPSSRSRSPLPPPSTLGAHIVTVEAAAAPRDTPCVPGRMSSDPALSPRGRRPPLPLLSPAAPRPRTKSLTGAWLKKDPPWGASIPEGPRPRTPAIAALGFAPILFPPFVTSPSSSQTSLRASRMPPPFFLGISPEETTLGRFKCESSRGLEAR